MKKLNWECISKWGIFLISLAGMLGSLYYGFYGDPITNIKQGTLFLAGGGIAPCDLCWYARILLYPMVLISGLAIYFKDRHFTRYIVPLAIMGLILEIYHYSMQMFGVGSIVNCSAFRPCSDIEVLYGGFITIPLLAGLSFAVILVLALIHEFWTER
jgi:disulfide bond formation protein DsbB